MLIHRPYPNKNKIIFNFIQDFFYQSIASLLIKSQPIYSFLLIINLPSFEPIPSLLMLSLLVTDLEVDRFLFLLTSETSTLTTRRRFFGSLALA